MVLTYKQMSYRQRITRVKADMVIITKEKITRAKVIQEKVTKEEVDTKIRMVKEIKVIRTPTNQGEIIEETIEEISLPEVTL